MKNVTIFPDGWNEESVQPILQHYESQTEEEAVMEDEAVWEDTTQTVMEIPLGKLFQLLKEPGVAGLPVLSVTMNDGLVHRDTLDRKTDGKLAPDEHLLIRKGDLAYNMMRMWQGASGSAKQDGIVSPAYVVVTPSDAIDPTFASYWFKSARMIHLFWAYSYGITGDRLRLYYRDFAKIPVTVPSKNDQIRIGKTLAAADRAIARTEGLIDAKRRLKEGLAERLLTGRCRLPGTKPEKWRHVRLADIATIIVSGVDKKSKPAETEIRLCNYTDIYYKDRIGLDCEFMIATASAAEIENYSLRKGDVIITKDSETPDDIAKPAVVIEDMPGVLCGYHLAILRPQKVHGPFLSHLLRLSLIRHEFYRVANGVTRYGLGRHAIASLLLKLPSYGEQLRIATVLDCLDRNVELLQTKLTALQETKRGLMQRLFADSASRVRLARGENRNES